MIVVLNNRTVKETISDRLLLLWLVYDAMKFSAIGDTKAHKLGYLSEMSMNNAMEKGFNYNFKKLPFGPYSDQLQKDVDWLEDQKLVDSQRYLDGKMFQSSRPGRKLLEDFREMFIRNNIFTRKIFAVNCKYASLNTHDLVETVHQQGTPEIENVPIDALENGEMILFRLPSDRAKVEFSILPEEFATLEVYLDNETYWSVMQAFESAKTKPLLNMDDVF